MRFSATQSLLAAGLVTLALTLDSALATKCPEYEVISVHKGKDRLVVCPGRAKNTQVEMEKRETGFSVMKNSVMKKNKRIKLGTYPTMDDSGHVKDTAGTVLEDEVLSADLARDLGIGNLINHGVCFGEVRRDENDEVPSWFLAYEKIIRHDVDNNEVFRITANDGKVKEAEKIVCKHASEDNARLLHRLCIDPSLTAESMATPLDFSTCLTKSNTAANAVKRFFREMGDDAWKTDFETQLFKEGGTLEEALANTTPQLNALLRRFLQLFGEVIDKEIRPNTMMSARAVLCSSSPAFLPDMAQLKVARLCSMNTFETTPVPIQNIERFIAEAGQLPPLKSFRERANAMAGGHRGALRRRRKEVTSEETVQSDLVQQA